MSSRYPILNNRPIDQLKVTELKEELRRRKLPVKGLKDDLIQRLDEALCIEMEAAKASEKGEANGFNGDAAGLNDSQTLTVVAEVVDTTVRKSAETVETAEVDNTGIVEPIETENAEKIPEVVHNDGNKSDKLDAVTIPVDINSSVPAMDQEAELMDLPAGVNSTYVGEESVDHSIPVDINSSVPAVDQEAEHMDLPAGVNSANVGEESVDHSIPVDINSSVPAVDQEAEHMDLPAGVDSANVGEESVDHASITQTTVTVNESVLAEVVFSAWDSYGTEQQKGYGDSVNKQENEESKAWLDNEESKPQLECDLKPLCEDVMPNSSVPENQVSEVNLSLGSQVKSDSFSSNSVSINQKNELKDTIITDDVKLEHDIVKPGILEEPLSRKDVLVNHESHSMHVGELPEKKASIEENNNNNRSRHLKKSNIGKDVGFPETLNLDRSSGDDSMEEDLLKSKQFDSKFNVVELRDKGETVEVSIAKEEVSTVVVGDSLSSKKSATHQDNDIPSVSLVEKRKVHDQASIGTNEPAKRLRRWNSDKGSDLQSPTLRSATTLKDEPIALKSNFSRSDFSTIDDALKEHIVPPSRRAPTNSLRIDRFLRPFTLKAVQELLGKTGNVISFWMDQIKTHCYITYSSVEEAVETRNAVYNLQWPPNGGRLLVAEYVDPQEVKMKLEAPPTPVPSVSSDLTVPITSTSSQPEPSPRQLREQPPVPATLPPPPQLSKLPPAASGRLPSPPSLPEKVDQPIVTLDDLFCKTRATPRIYYVPLSEEQVAAKLAAQGKSIKQ